MAMLNAGSRVFARDDKDGSTKQVIIRASLERSGTPIEGKIGVRSQLFRKIEKLGSDPNCFEKLKNWGQIPIVSKNWGQIPIVSKEPSGSFVFCAPLKFPNVCSLQIDVRHHPAHVLAGAVVGVGFADAAALAQVGSGHVVEWLGGVGAVGF
ncbi:hypothetical protein [Limnohabitans sp. 63ED37-2]|uniref:hypothetical protein n=1 Tax=Limnohabitans sp. 63ED37-2 TaxID=1678128 RepID=UPI001E5C8A9F|nr:hypothetical protein [Limnohabitans sp. 63ED37-2]